MIQAIYRSNFIIMGAPLIANLFNTDKIPLTALLLAVVVPFYNVSSVIILEIFRGNDISAKKIFSGIAHNPLLRSALLGLILSILHITLPTVIEKPISEIAKAASPLALIILGASFPTGFQAKRWLSKIDYLYFRQTYFSTCFWFRGCLVVRLQRHGAGYFNCRIRYA